MINRIDLQYFLELAQTLHVSRASERLGVTQPTLSYALKRIETDLKAQLFVRTKKGLELTSSGEKLLNEASELIALWDRVLTSVSEDVHEVSGRIRLGCHTAVAQYSLPELLPQILKSHPKLEFDLQHGLSRHMTEQVIASKLDAAIVVNPVQHPDLVIKELLRDQMTLWRVKGCLNPDVLLLEPSLTQTQDILAKLKKHRTQFQRTVTSPSLEVLAQLLASGAGYAVLPERVIRAFHIERFEKVPNAPSFNDRICLIYKREFTRTQRGKVFVKAAAELR
jgi:LysR family transcriptional regulator, cell division regulator